MGVINYVFHHPTRTMVCLEKGPWARVDYNLPLLELVDLALEEWGMSWPDPRDQILYCCWICGCTQHFLRTGRWEAEPSTGPLAGDLLTDHHEQYGRRLWPQHSDTPEALPYREVGDEPRTPDYEAEVLRMLSREDLDLLIACWLP